GRCMPRWSVCVWRQCLSVAWCCKPAQMRSRTTGRCTLRRLSCFGRSLKRWYARFRCWTEPARHQSDFSNNAASRRPSSHALHKLNLTLSEYSGTPHESKVASGPGREVLDPAGCFTVYLVTEVLQAQG